MTRRRFGDLRGPVFVGVRVDAGPRVLVRYPTAPWLEDVGQVVEPLVCPMGHAGLPAQLTVKPTGSVGCDRCGNVWGFRVSAMVDVTAAGPVLVAGRLESYPTSCRMCGCTDTAACQPPDGPCWWIAPGVCSTHDLRSRAVPA